MAAIYSYDTGDVITEGLQGSSVCDEAILCAQRIAGEKDEPVVLDDDNGCWVVYPGGKVEEADEMWEVE